MSDDSMTVNFPGGQRVDAAYKEFVIATDQSTKQDGDGSAPEPYDYFLASLATCAGIYVLRFCQKRDISTDGIRLRQSWERDEKTKKICDIRIEIEVPPEFPEKYHSALVRSANQCAVKKTIEDPPGFHIDTVVSGG
jgi:ribosomal protein S12 methylthiotransferase accessory factor